MTASLQRCETPQRVSCIWTRIIWWWGPSNAGALGNVEYPLVAIVPWSTMSTNKCPWYDSNRVLSMGQTELNCAIIINWNAWNWTVFVCQTELFQIELFFFYIETLPSHNLIDWNRIILTFNSIKTILILNLFELQQNLIAWNRNAFTIKLNTLLNWIVWTRTVYFVLKWIRH